MDPSRDHFSALAERYARYRPGYPQELFAFLAELAPAPSVAWDCATGSGQAAVGLASHFERVIATDGSARQLAAAATHPKVDYQVAEAERSGLASGSVDLVTVAQALHWFDLERFYAEVRRVVRPGGLIAVWSYNLLTISEPVDRLVNRLYDGLLGPYWPPERALVEQGYAAIPFPFELVGAPRFAMDAQWSLDQLTGYLQTWSAARRYREATGQDALALIAPALSEAWGEPAAVRPVSWPLVLRVGRVG